MTAGMKFESALACRSKEEASWWMSQSIGEVYRERSLSWTQAAEQVVFFLGFMTAYYNDPETATKMKELFGLDFSVFGSPTEKIDDHRRRKRDKGK